MESCFYEGKVRHRRFHPVRREFSYGLFMVYLDLAELPGLFDGSWLWSARRWAPARFRRNDYLGDPSVPLDSAVRDLVAERTGSRPAGPIRLLTHLRYFGYCFNPVSLYYCFSEGNTAPEAIVADVSNTPWGERHAYVLTEPDEVSANDSWKCRFGKAMHVSPFLGMDMEYRCVFGYPGKTLTVHMEDWRQDEPVLDATLTLRKKTITAASRFSQLVRFPLMTQRVIAAIYWQALLIRLRGVRYHAHPGFGNSAGDS